MIRARIVLAAAQGGTNTEIAAEVGVHIDTVRKWRRRFVAAGLAGLEDLPRSGRRRGFTPVQVAEVKALACTLPRRDRCAVVAVEDFDAIAALLANDPADLVRLPLAVIDTDQ